MAKNKTPKEEKTKTTNNNTKKSRKKTDSEWLSTVESLYNADRAWRASTVDKQWWINRSYYAGNQSIKYNPKTGRLIDDPNDPLKLHINRVKVAVRVARSVLTRTNPVWDVDSYPYGAIPAGQVKLLNQFMGKLYEKLDLKVTVKEAVFYALTCGLGIFQYGWDEEADDKEGEVWVDALDPMDTYFGGKSTTGMEDCERITKVVSRSIQYMQEKEEEGIYKNTKNLTSTGKTSDSTYKEMLNLVNQNASVGGGAGEDDGSVLVRETWLSRPDGVWVITWTDGVLHRAHKTEFKKLPFVLYLPDINPGQLYGEGWVKDLIPLQRAINYLHRKIMKYNEKMAVGVWVTDQESGVSMITNESGQFIKKQRGAELSSETPRPLNNTPFTQLEDLYRQFQDISGVQEALIGRNPTGVTAAIAIETLVANAASNFVDLIDNLGIAMANLGECLLDLAYDSYSVTKTIKIKDASGNESVIKVGGKDAKMSGKEIKEGKALRLPERSDVRVKVVEGGTYTRQARIELLAGLRQLGDIDRHTYLTELGLDADSIEMKLAQELSGQPNTSLPGGEPSVEQIPEGGQYPGQQLQPDAGQEIAAPQSIGIEEFLAILAEQGVVISPEIEANPDVLEGIVSGEVPVDIIGGVLTLI